MNKMYIDSIQWNHPSTTLLAVLSNSGENNDTFKILQHKNNPFTRSKLKTVLFYNQDQEIYKKLRDDGLLDYSSKGIPSLNDFVTK